MFIKIEVYSMADTEQIFIASYVCKHMLLIVLQHITN